MGERQTKKRENERARAREAEGGRGALFRIR